LALDTVEQLASCPDHFMKFLREKNIYKKGAGAYSQQREFANRGAKNPGAWLPWQLNFVQWCLTFSIINCSFSPYKQKCVSSHALSGKHE
jgi:hypothetical protein